MSAPDVVAAPDPPGAPAPRRGAVRRTGAVLAAVALVAGGGWWATHPDRLDPVGNGLEGPLAVGETGLYGLFPEPGSGEVEVLGVEPVVVENGSRADLRLLLCRHEPGADVVGSARGRAEQLCDGAADPRGEALRPLREGGAQLVLEVVPRRPGTLVVEGVRVRYRAGLQRGEQQSGLVLTVRTG